MAGRLHIAHAVREAFLSRGVVQSLVMPSALSRMTFSRVAEACWAWLRSWARRPLLPLQCALFSASSDVDRLIEAIDDRVETVYLDGVRLHTLLRALRTRRPDLRLVVDLDDLMSRRARLLLEMRQAMAPGYVAANLPFGLKRLLSAPLIDRLVPRYEEATLIEVEKDALRLADAVVLLSSTDTDELRRRSGGVQDVRATIHNIPPSVHLHDGPPMAALKRFVFIGSDSLTQNRLTIDFLLQRWSEWRLSTPLVIYGHQQRNLALPPNVSMPGYADSIADVYDGASALVTPSFVGGGVKTKVLEAFSYGAAVIGNPCTFESLPVDDYPLLIDDNARLREILSDPAAHLDVFLRAARLGQAYVREHHSEQRFNERWLNVVAATTDEARIGHVR